jgi:hypothetical protein
VPDERLMRSVDGIARALDVVGSRRPLTAVLVGPSPTITVLAELSKTCRVLPIGLASNEPGDQPIKDWLSALLPLDIPAAAVNLDNPLASLESATERDVPASRLLKAARSGKEAVSEEFLRQIEEALSPPPEQADER